MITVHVLVSIGARYDRAALYVAPLQIAAKRYGIDTPARVACWLGQLSHESGRFTTVVENLYYSADRLARVWPARYADGVGGPNATAQRIAKHPQDIANLTYADRLGNGSAGSGDGWRYRGRGLIQITGRTNYSGCGDALGLDLLARPDLLEQPLYAALSAGWYWHQAGLNKAADRLDIASITRSINGGAHGLLERIELTNKALAALGGR